MTLLSVIQEACLAMALPRPTTLSGAATPLAQTLVQLSAMGGKILARTHEDETPLGRVVARGAAHLHAVDFDVEVRLRVFQVVADEAARGTAHDTVACQVDGYGGGALRPIGAPRFRARPAGRGSQRRLTPACVGCNRLAVAHGSTPARVNGFGQTIR